MTQLKLQRLYNVERDEKIINADGIGICNEAIGSQFKCFYYTYQKRARKITNSGTTADYPTDIHVQV
jgi:hypothetical protein